ncbi:MAG TPA: hypothetical protein VGE90_10560 [Chitinophaga sp.]
MLALPITIRIPTDDEISYRPDFDEILHKRRKARIQEGYTLGLNEAGPHRLPYRFQATINIDNNRLWDLFQALALTLPAKVCCAYGLSEDESATTGLLQKQFILNELEKYREELTQDCQLAFSLLFQTKEVLIELGVSESKYIRYWGVELERFKLLMQSFRLPAVKGLEFIDEYPKIVTPLRELLPSAKAPESVVYYLDQAFQVDRSGPEPYFD